MDVFRYEKDDAGIVTLTLDMPGRSANVIDETFGAGFREVLERLRKEEELAGVILTSGKALFLAGADLDGLYPIRDPAVIFERAEALKAALRELETLGKPVVAALNGTALGGGMELALACHHRIALDHPKSRFGFPEVSLGLLPGGGGITRLVRMVGLMPAFPILMEGTRFTPREALDRGLIDELAETPEEMFGKARAWIAAHPTPKKGWYEKGFEIPGGSPANREIARMLAVGPAMLRKKTRGNYPAPHAIMAAAVEGAQVDFDTACRIESRYMAKLATGQVSKNMMTAFWYHLNEIEKGGNRPKGIPPQETRKVGVLGAGMMGHGIAYVSAYAGMAVVLKDLSREAAQKGKERIARIVEGRVSRGKLDRAAAEALLDRIHPTADAGDLAGCDLVIEAVFENREVKAKVTRETEAVMDPNGVFASNTSTLPITSLARASVRPERFIGLHFFSPVHKMKLVEIIVGAKTSDETIAKAFDYVQKIRKIPIVVNDNRGFFTSRVFGTYVEEGMTMLGEGYHPQGVESAGLQAGFPVGPLAVSDEVSLGLMDHIRRQTIEDFAAEGREYRRRCHEDVLDRMIELGRLGRAHGGGFYDYPEGGKRLWPGLLEHFPRRKDVDLPEMIDRILFVQAVETVRAMEENVLRSVADANIGSIFGWGFPPFHGGVLQFIDAYGTRAFVARARELAHRYGPRFEPPSRLLAMAERDERFFAGPAPKR